MSVLDQLSERHIECFRSILGECGSCNSITFFSNQLTLAEHQRPVLAGLYGTYRTTKKRQLQTV